MYNCFISVFEDCPGLTGSLDWWVQGKVNEQLIRPTKFVADSHLAPGPNATFLFILHSSKLLTTFLFKNKLQRCITD